jgi:HD-GYP domain-containing protein (c-di-GMP phosphodiesterase class II)
MGLPSHVLSDLYLAGLLHDIGMIGLNDRVLRKDGPLSAEEFVHFQEHVLIGDRLLANVKQLAPVRPGVRNHHERYDGQGYPDRLAGTDIPLSARVLAVADACDAMISARPHRPALPIPQIDAVLAEGAGAQWDPVLISYLMECRHELYTIAQQGGGGSVVTEAGRVGQPAGDDALRNNG